MASGDARVGRVGNYVSRSRVDPLHTAVSNTSIRYFCFVGGLPCFSIC